MEYVQCGFTLSNKVALDKEPVKRMIPYTLLIPSKEFCNLSRKGSLSDNQSSLGRNQKKEYRY